MKLSTLAIQALVLVVLWAILQFLVLPYVRLQQKRAAARKHKPQPEEIWVQDDGIIYIHKVDASGVEWLTFAPETKEFTAWKDTWGQWAERLELRTVWFTGQRQPLGPE